MGHDRVRPPHWGMPDGRPALRLALPAGQSAPRQEVQDRLPEQAQRQEMPRTRRAVLAGLPALQLEVLAGLLAGTETWRSGLSSGLPAELSALTSGLMNTEAEVGDKT